MPATKDVDPQVILVDEKDAEIGRAGKLAAHQQGLMHRAFSVFIFRKNCEGDTELLLQQRAQEKYHSAGLWTNTCCSHPSPDEDLIEAAKRRLIEELGLHITELRDKGQFHYIAHFDNGLVENELDHVLIGYHHGEHLVPNPAEVQALRWITPDELQAEMRQRPEQFTAWLAQALAVALKH